MSKNKKANLVLPVFCAVCALYLMYEGLTTAGHGTLSVCEEHVHTSKELLVFLGIGTAVFFLGAFLACAAVMLLRSPTVRLIYLSAFGIVFALQSLVSLAPQIPGLTEHASSCLVNLVLWAAYWLVCPRIVRFYGLKEDLQSSWNLGLALFCIYAVITFIPPSVPQVPASVDLVILLVFIVAALLLGQAMVDWRLLDSRPKPVVGAVIVAAILTVGGDRAYRHFWPLPVDEYVAAQQEEILEKHTDSYQTLFGKWGEFAFPYLTEGSKRNILTGLVQSKNLQPKNITDDTSHSVGVKLVSRALTMEYQQALHKAGNDENRLPEKWRRCRNDPRSDKLSEIQEEVDKLKLLYKRSQEASSEEQLVEIITDFRTVSANIDEKFKEFESLKIDPPNGDPSKAFAKLAKISADSTPQNPSGLPVGTEIGMVAPEIMGEDIDGNVFKLSDYRGKVVVLDFWGDW